MKINLADLMKKRLDPNWWENSIFIPDQGTALSWFETLEAGWAHNYDPSRPHVILHSGNHGDVFFLCKRLLKFGNLRELLAAGIIHQIREALGGLPPIGGVFGSPYSSILLAGDVGRLLGVPTYVPEKDPKDSEGKGMIFKPDDLVPEGAALLQIEELVTTWTSGKDTREAMEKAHPYSLTFVPVVGVLVHRPAVVDRNLPDGRKIVPLIERQANNWKPEECPLCKQGSQAIYPKKEWAKLTA